MGVLESDLIHVSSSACKVLTRAAQDVRVLVIKFADRMHNMRTLEQLHLLCESATFRRVF